MLLAVIISVGFIFSSTNVTESKPTIYAYSPNLRYNISVQTEGSKNITILVLSLELSPWTNIRNETLFCIYNLEKDSLIEVENSPLVRAYVSNGSERCIIASIENNSPRFQKVTFTVKIIEENNRKNINLIPGIIAGIALVGISYTFFSENAKKKIFLYFLYLYHILSMINKKC